MMIWAGLTFAAMNVGVKLVPNIPSSEIVFFRAIISFFISYVIVKRNKISLWGNNKKVLIMRGLFGTAALMMFFYTLQVMPLASAMVIHYLSPIFTAILAHFFLKEHLHLRTLFFFGVSFFGILIMKRFDTDLETMDVLLGVGAALFSGAAYNCIRFLKQSENSHVIIFYFPMIAFPITLMYTLVFSGWVWPNWQELGILLFIGILTQIAQYFLTRAYQTEVANKVAAVSNIGVIYAFVIGYFGFAEVFDWRSIFGMVLVVAGVVLNVVLKPIRNATKQPSGGS